MQTLTFNRETLKDKIYACWVGKNIGGTMGTPYEGNRDVHDIQGFVTEEGKVLPNDDLDLQLVWLRAMDEMGPESVNERVLGEYWMTHIGPMWNEYGVGKSNMREGLLPPLAGEVYNDKWKHSNGAWIRTEIWACLFPGCPEKAIRYAFYDACVDHGYGEGTYAAIFVAAMESAAFVIKDVKTLLEIGLSKIPTDCRMAKAVRLVMEEYEKGTDWKTVRQMLVEQSADIGWFQAPANVGFVVLGLLYGEGDFKKSMILAINCGDDTDCTGATIGSLMGIMNGIAGLPSDWRSHIGDQIATICNLNGHGAWPATCTELTERVMDMLPRTMHTYKNFDSIYGNVLTGHFKPYHEIKLGDADDFSGMEMEKFTGDSFVKNMFNRSCYSFRERGVYADVWVELDSLPEITPMGTISGRISVEKFRMPSVQHYHVRWLLPEGWSVSGKSNLYIVSKEMTDPKAAEATFTITAGEKVAATNRLVLEVSVERRPTCIDVPVMLLG